LGFHVAIGANGEPINGELPIGHRAELDERNIIDGLSHAVGHIYGTVGDKAGVSSHRDLLLTVHPDGEKFHVEVGQQVLHWWDDIVDSQGWPTQSHDPIDWLIAEDIGDRLGQTELLGGIAQAGEAQDIDSQGSITRARAVLDGEELTVVLEGGRLGAIETMLLEAGLGVTHTCLCGALIGIDNPQVGATSVGDNGHGLWGCSQGDVAKVEVIVVINQWLTALSFVPEQLLELGWPGSVLDHSSPEGWRAHHRVLEDLLWEHHSVHNHHEGSDED